MCILFVWGTCTQSMGAIDSPLNKRTKQKWSSGEAQEWQSTRGQSLLLPRAVKLGRSEKGACVLELPFRCLPQPLPARKQEARLGHLPEALLGQEAEGTSVEDCPPYRRGSREGPARGNAPAPVHSFLRARAARTPQHGLRARRGPHRIHRDASVREEQSQEPPLRSPGGRPV